MPNLLSWGFYLDSHGYYDVKTDLSPSSDIPRFRLKNKNVNTISVFGLGLMSGLTSACCAPVLFAAVTLTSLSPSLLQALIVSLAYIVGIVMPLFVLSMLWESFFKICRFQQV